jgi:hypothetical protein
MKSAHFLIAGLSVALGGCGVMGVGSPRTMVRCTGTCTVMVPVTMSGSTCTIGLPPTHRIRVGPQNQPTIIRWQISSDSDSQFKFRNGNAIAFDKPTGPPPPSIMQNGAGGARVVTINDNHSSATTQGSWDYTIYVTGNGSVACKLDPTVVNDDGTTSEY